jgi:hypothetical protein
MTWYKYRWGFPEDKIRGEKIGGKGWGVENLLSKGFVFVTEDWENNIVYGINKRWDKDEFLSAEKVEIVSVKSISPKRYLSLFIKAIFEEYLE